MFITAGEASFYLKQSEYRLLNCIKRFYHKETIEPLANHDEEDEEKGYRP